MYHCLTDRPDEALVSLTRSGWKSQTLRTLGVPVIARAPGQSLGCAAGIVSTFFSFLSQDSDETRLPPGLQEIVFLAVTDRTAGEEQARSDNSLSVSTEDKAEGRTNEPFRNDLVSSSVNRLIRELNDRGVCLQVTVYSDRPPSADRHPKVTFLKSGGETWE